MRPETDNHSACTVDRYVYSVLSNSDSKPKNKVMFQHLRGTEDDF